MSEEQAQKKKSKKVIKYNEKCTICQKQFRYKHHLNQHMAVHTGEKKFVCRICKNGYQQKWNLITHVQRVHAKIHPFKCKDCGKTFGYSTHFKRHVKIHLLEKVNVPHEIKNKILNPFACTHCSKGFCSNSKLKLHVSTHHGNEAYICEKCGKAFKNKYTITEHIRTFHDPDDYEECICDQCGNIYKSKRALKQHLRQGHAPRVPKKPRKPWKYYNPNEKVTCEVCGKVMSKCSLRNHLNIHYKTRYYPCRYCDKKFLEYGNRKNHERTHTGEKPFVCEVCGKKHAQLGNLITHRKTAHQLTSKVERIPQQREMIEMKLKQIKMEQMRKENKENVGRASVIQPIPKLVDKHKKNKTKESEEPVDYTRELKKLKEFVVAEVKEETVGEKEEDVTLQSLVTMTDNWVSKRFQDCKEKRVKKNECLYNGERIEELCEVNLGVVEGENKEEEENDVDYDDIQQTNTPEPVLEENNIEETYTDDDDDNIPLSELVVIKEEPRMEESEEEFENPKKYKKEKKQLFQDEKLNTIFEEVLENVTVFKNKMNDWIYKELKKELEELLKDKKKEYEVLLKKIKQTEKEKARKSILSVFLKKYTQMPNNKIVEKFKDKEVWSCWICGTKFKNHFCLNRHLIIHAPEDNPFECPMCSSKCTQLNNLKQHIMMHTNQQVFYCEVCGAGFRHRTNFKIHLFKHGYLSPQYVPPKKNYSCSFCGKAFYTRYHMAEHERTHTKESPYLCKLCGKRYRARSTFTKHMKAHSNIKDHECSLCGKRFATKYLVDRHLVTHSGEKNFKCDCGKVFSQKGSLNKHSLYCSNNERPAEKTQHCHLCTKSFYYKHDLERHIQTHDPNKKFQCEICSMLLKTKLSHKRHIERHMKGQLEDLQCKHCSVQFGSKKMLKEHKIQCLVIRQLPKASVSESPT